jgi:hypothetical protein
MFLWRESLVVPLPPDGGYNTVIPLGFKTSFVPSVFAVKNPAHFQRHTFIHYMAELMCIDKAVKPRGY